MVALYRYKHDEASLWVDLGDTAAHLPPSLRVFAMMLDAAALEDGSVIIDGIGWRAERRYPLTRNVVVSYNFERAVMDNEAMIEFNEALEPPYRGAWGASR